MDNTNELTKRECIQELMSWISKRHSLSIIRVPFYIGVVSRNVSFNYVNINFNNQYSRNLLLNDRSRMDRYLLEHITTILIKHGIPIIDIYLSKLTYVFDEKTQKYLSQ